MQIIVKVDDVVSDEMLVWRQSANEEINSMFQRLEQED